VLSIGAGVMLGAGVTHCPVISGLAAIVGFVIPGIAADGVGQVKVPGAIG